MFVFGKDVAMTPAGEGVERKVLGYSEAMMICEIKMKKGEVIPSHAIPMSSVLPLFLANAPIPLGRKRKKCRQGTASW